MSCVESVGLDIKMQKRKYYVWVVGLEVICLL